jgi:hypothetical protein
VPEKIKGWASIAKYMGQPTATVQHWAKSGMPVTRDGRSVVASPEELNKWLGHESGRQTKILTNETDLSALLKHGLKDARAGRKRSSAKQPDNRRPRQRKLPPPKPAPQRYSPALPLSQVESRVSGMEKRIAQLQEIMKSLQPADRRKTSSEIKALKSAIAHYTAGLDIESDLSGIPKQDTRPDGHSS